MAVYATPAQVMHFDPKKFDDQIDQHGTPALWRRARTCPCLDRRSGQPDPSCQFCFEGTLWDVGGTETKVLAPGRRRGDQYDESGYWMQGIVTMTFKSTITPGHFDRFDFLAAQMVVNNDLNVRGSGGERTRMPVIEVQACDAIVNDELIDCREGLRIDEQNRISWADGFGPPDNARYSMRYLARPVWVVWSPMSRDENAVKMPYRAACQRLDFFKRPAPEAS